MNGVDEHESNVESSPYFRPDAALGGDPGKGEYFAGDIAEILVFDRVLTPSERQGLNDYLRSRFAPSMWPDGTPPVMPEPPPRDLDALHTGYGEITLGWTAGNDAYEVQRLDEETGRFVTIATVPAGAGEYVDSGLKPNRRYEYQLLPKGAGRISPSS